MSSGIERLRKFLWISASSIHMLFGKRWTAIRKQPFSLLRSVDQRNNHISFEQLWLKKTRRWSKSSFNKQPTATERKTFYVANFSKFWSKKKTEKMCALQCNEQASWYNIRMLQVWCSFMHHTMFRIVSHSDQLLQEWCREHQCGGRSPCLKVNLSHNLNQNDYIRVDEVKQYFSKVLYFMFRFL